MKRLICLMLILILLPLTALAAKSKAKTEVKLPKDLKLTLTEGKFETYTQTFQGDWESSDPAVANAEIEVNSGSKVVRIIGFTAGEATLTLKGKKSTATVHVTVKEDETRSRPVPEEIQAAIGIALDEWRENGGQNLTNEVKTNKYLKWWGAKCEWCGVFATYCLEKAGIPMAAEGDENKTAKLTPGPDGAPYSIRVGGVGRFRDAFINMDRATRIPRPGYLVIYGNNPKKGTPSNRHHVALVTDVQDRGDGTYQVSTVEGNWDFVNVKKLKNVVTRFCYVYDPANVTCQNISPVPEDERTDPDAFNDYVTHLDERPYYVYMFCQTWY